mgnify:FL=1
MDKELDNKMINEESIKISNQMLSIISELDEFKGSWKLLGQLSPYKLKTLKKIAAIESVGSSNRIEGNKLNDKQVEELLSNINKQSFATRDEQEVAGYAKLMDTIFADYEVIPFSENYIKQLHKILLQYSTKDERRKGNYKTISNTVAAYSQTGEELGIVFETATPFEAPLKMEQLVNWTRKNLDDKYFHPLIVIGLFIVNFLAIHPFEDGNGRLSRAITCLLLLKTCYLYMQYSSLEAVIEDNKEGYYRALRQTQITLKNDEQDYEPWLIFFLKSLQKQKIRLEYKLNEKRINLDNKDLTELEMLILKYFEQNESGTNSTLLKYTASNRNTLKKAISSLVNKGYLTQHSKGRGTWYSPK